MKSIKSTMARRAGHRRVLSPLVALTVLAGVGILLSSPQAAQAQVSKIIPLRLKLGVMLPSDRDTKNISGSTHFSGEVDIALPSSGGGQQSLFSVGYSRGSRGGNSYQIIPVSLTKISSPPNPAGRLTGNVYYGAGVGLYFVQAKGIPVSGGFSASKKRTLFGSSLVAGYQTPTSFFIEAKYHLVIGTVDGYSPNGLSLFIGKRL